MTTITTLLPEPSFVDRDPSAVTADLVAAFEAALGKTLYPAQVERVLLDMLAYRETLLRIAIQEAARQNLATYARAPMLDHLGALTGAVRLPPAPARTQIEFTLPMQAVTVTIPQGTAIQNSDGGIVFATAEDCAIPAGQTTGSVWADAEIKGSAMNGVTVGALTVVPVPAAPGLTARNISVSYGGAEAETDDHYRLRVMLAPERDACGTIAAYQLAALSVHPDILDVAVTSDAPGRVTVSAATATGSPDEGLLDLIRTRMDDERFKPLTDQVTVIAPQRVEFVIDMNLTIAQGAQATTAAMVQTALEGYTAILRKTLGQDLSPSRFIAMAQGLPGVQAVVLISPPQTALTAHQYADCSSISVTVTGVGND
jgi:phage-related baseplate assembly protein